MPKCFQKASDFFVSHNLSLYVRSKDRVSWTTFLWKASGAKFSLFGLGGGMKGRILYLHLCGIWGQSSKMKGHPSSEVTRWDTTHTHTKERTLKQCWSEDLKNVILTHLGHETEEEKNQRVCLLDLEAMRSISSHFSCYVSKVVVTTKGRYPANPPLKKKKKDCQITPSSAFHKSPLLAFH